MPADSKSDRDDSGRGLSALVDRLEERVIAQKEFFTAQIAALRDEFRTYVKNTDEKTKLQAEKYETRMTDLNHENARVQENANKGTPRELWDGGRKEQAAINSRMEAFMSSNADLPAFRVRTENYMAANANLGDFRTRAGETLAVDAERRAASTRATSIWLAVGAIVIAAVGVLVSFLIRE